jgi:uncharacterized repeat protein (TIGR01451 family)
VTQADIDAGTYNNTACVDDGAGGAAEACDDADVPAVQSPQLTVDKSSTTTVITTVGQVVPYTFVVTNAGNVTLTGVTLTDTKVSSLTCTPSQPATLAPGATMNCSGNHTVTQAEFDDASHNLVNTATADSDQTGPATDSVTIPITPPTIVAQITPTATTCSQFAAGTSPTLSTLQYSVKGNPPKINQVNPGVFFYWVKVSGGGTYTITQTATPPYKTFTMASGSAVFNASCTKLGSATLTQNSSTGTVTVTFSGTGTFYIGIKYDASSVSGQAAPGGSGTIHYEYTTTGVAGSTQGLNLVKK